MARDPKAEVEISAHSRTLGARLRSARAKFQTFGAELKKNVFGKDLVEKGFWSKAGASMVGNLGANVAGAVGGFLLDQGKGVLDFNDQIKRLQIAAGKTPEFMNDFSQSVRSASSDIGIDAANILDGAKAYVALTGDMDGAAASARVWTRVAQATDSSVNDIAQTAAAMKQQMGIGPAEMEATFSALAVQGKAGAIELKDLAAQMSTIAPQWAQFSGGKGVQGVKELGAALQIVKRGFGGDAGETVTGLQSFLTSAVQHSKQLKKGGFDVFTKNAKTGKMELKGVLDIVDGIANSKLAKNPTKLIKALGRVEAYRAFIQLRDNRAELDKLVEASGDAGAIQRDLSTYMQSSAGKMKVAWQTAKNEIADAFTPERVETFTKAIVGLTKAASTLVGGLSRVVDVGGALVDLGHYIGSGFEDSDERKQLMADKRRIEQRRQILRGQILAENPKLAAAAMLGDSDINEKIDEMAQYRMGREDALINAIGSGERLTSARGAQVNIPLLKRFKDGSFAVGYNQVGGRTIAKEEGYGVEELVAMKRTRAGGSDDLRLQRAIDAQIGKRVADEIAKLNTNIMALVGKQVVQIDGKAVVTAVKNSPAHARRPGG